MSLRPAIVTLLCLARDAASRMPDGVGTRADILELIKQSQWVKLESTPSDTLNNIVSGALDRLHQQDQCVRYDSDKKVWIYMHASFKIDNVEWQSDPLSGHIMATNSFIPDRNHPMIDRWLESRHKEAPLGKRTHSQAFGQL